MASKRERTHETKLTALSQLAEMLAPVETPDEAPTPVPTPTHEGSIWPADKPASTLADYYAAHHALALAGHVPPRNPANDHPRPTRTGVAKGAGKAKKAENTKAAARRVRGTRKGA